MKRSVWSLLLGSAVLLAACTAESDDWRAAQAADTSLAYSHFASQHPDSSHAAEARSRAAARAAAETVVAAPAEPSPASVVPPVALSPPVASAPAAPAPAPAAAAPAPVVPAPAPAAAAPVASTPAQPPTAAPKAPASAPRPVAAKASGFGVQIGAFSTQDKAEAQWRLIEQRHRRELAGATHQVAAGKAGSRPVYRLKVPQASQAAAKDLCRRLSAAGQACVVYHP